MLELLTCAKGHSWRPEAQASCPVCGSLPSQPSAQLYDNATAPTLPPGNLEGGATVAPQPELNPNLVLWPSVKGYEIQGVLGRGGMGIVYKARQIGLDRLVALKMVLGGIHASPDELERFRREAEAVAKLQHPNIVQIYEVGDCEGRPYLSLEFIGGGSLAQKLNGLPMPAAKAAGLMATLARAIHLAHERGIVHRDLKPANVLLTEDGTPKITDFGLAKRLDRDSGRTRSGAIMGTPAYMAPEQASGKSKEVGPATDVYALGAILYELLTGQAPFRAETPIDTVLLVLEREPPPPRALNPMAARELEAICLKCLEKDKTDRYQSAAALAEDLERYLDGVAVSVGNFNVMNRLARTLDRSQYDVEFHGWSTMLLLFAPIMLLAHSTIFALGFHEPPYPLGWTRAVHLTEYGLLAAVFWVYGSTRWRAASSSERLLRSIWLGYIAASVIIGTINREMQSGDASLSEVALYPSKAVLAGLAFFAMGGSYWGRCYAFGIAFFLLAVTMPLNLEWAPLLFGMTWFVILLRLARRLRWLNKRATVDLQRDAATVAS
jgi:serine/threonine protein kinase